MQQVGQWNATGMMQTWQEIAGSWQPSQSLQLTAVAAVPRMNDTSRLRLRMSRRLTSRLALSGDYGRLAPYQSMTSTSDRPRLRVMVTRHWLTATPAAGVKVSGSIVDQLERPVAHALVRLGDFTTSTDALGTFRFVGVPKGHFTLTLDPAYLPADYAWDGIGVPVDTTGSLPGLYRLRVAPLNTISGMVRRRPHDGADQMATPLAGAVIALDGLHVTVTDAGGGYRFYNVSPGRHTVSIVRTGMPWVEPETGQVAADLAAGRAVTGLDLMTIESVAPTIWKTFK
jgi:hypothetical protein